MPSKKKSNDRPNEEFWELNGSSQTSNKIKKSNGGTRTESHKSSSSGSESESSPSASQPSSQNSQEPSVTSSQVSNKMSSSINSKSRSQNTSCSDSDSNSNGSRQVENSQKLKIINSQQSNKSTSSVGSKRSQPKSQNLNKSNSDSESYSDSVERPENSQRSSITNSQQSSKSTSLTGSNTSQRKLVNSSNSGCDSDSNSDGSQQVSNSLNNSNVAVSQNSSIHNDSLQSKKSGYFSDSEDQMSAQNSTANSIRPQDDSDSDAIINSNKKKTFSKSSIRRLVDDDSSSGSDSQIPQLKMAEVASDSDKSSTSKTHKTIKSMKSKSRIIEDNDSGSSDDDSAAQKPPPRKSGMHFSSDTGTGATIPNWKKSMGSDLLDDSSSEDERGLLTSPVPSLDADTELSPKLPNKKFGKTEGKSSNKISSKKAGELAGHGIKTIHSHSQRHRRVERAELPYHVPRQRSLAEFMARRQTLPATKNKSLKMPVWELKEHWKQMADQEKEAKEFFKSESEPSGDETEESATPVLAIETKDLHNQHMDENEVLLENTIIKQASKKSQSLQDSGLVSDANMENDKATSAEKNKLDATCLTSKENIPQAVLINIATAHDLSPKMGDKMEMDLQIECFVTPASQCAPILRIASSNTDDKDEPGLVKNQNSFELNAVNKADDYSSDSDVALRLSDSEDEKEKELSKIEAKRAPSTDVSKKKEIVGLKSAFDKEISDDSLDSGNEATSNNKPASVLEKTNDNQENKKLAMLRRRGLINIANIKPRLSGSKNEIIDLEEEITSKQSGMMDLMQRFLKHSSKKKPKVERAEMDISIVSAEKGADGLENVTKELVTVLLGEEEESRDPVPGAKLQRLKQTLQKQMALKRTADWERKMEEKKINSQVLGNGETSDCGMLDEETEMTDSEDDAEDEVDNEEIDDEEADDEEEEEEEEIGKPLKEKKRPQSEFFDEEADETDDGDADISDDEDEEDIKDDGKDSDKEGYAKTADDSMDKIISEDDITVKNKQKKSKFKRLQTFDMFDSDDDLETSIVEKWAAMETQNATSPTSPTIPAGQAAKSPVESQFLVSPMCFNRRSAPTQESPIASPSSKDVFSKANDENCISSTQDYLNEIMKGTTSKAKEPSHISSLTKLLCKDDAPSTQAEEDELLSLCSGKFHTQVYKTTDDELAELCSGRFPTQTQKPSELQLENEEELQNNQIETDYGNYSQDAQVVSWQSQSQGKESQNDKSSQKTPTTVQPWNDLEIMSSNDEEEVQFKHSESQLKKKPQKKLNFSDDEDMNEEAVESADEVDPELVDYDSEENEVPMGAEQSRKAAKEFFEAEAELSESEWGSADEDEQDLDKLDYVAADEEHFDQDQMKEQLDKLHMRQVLDADKREVRMLQEMLFEDGDLHSEGGGRERKFRWKNAGNDDMNAGLLRESGDEAGGDEDEAEDEEKWRIMRHERETFLREQKEKAKAAGKEDKGILEDEDSQFLKLGKAALKRIRTVHSQELIAIERKITLRKTVSDAVLSPDAKRKLNPVVQRGSFLARGESALARIAALTRGTTGKVVVSAKNSRNFVFATISPKEEEIEEPVKLPGKRKAPVVTPILIKKSKVTEDNKSKGRRLFDHLV